MVSQGDNVDVLCLVKQCRELERAFEWHNYAAFCSPGRMQQMTDS